MSYQIQITAGEVVLRAELNESNSARAIYQALPIVAHGSRWGEEIYFPIPVDSPLESDATEDVEVAELGYWPPGKAFCIFFGPTPASTGDAPKAASAVNRIGRIMGDLTPLYGVPQGAEVRIERVAVPSTEREQT